MIEQMGYLISTHLGYQRPFQRLLTSLWAAGITSERIAAVTAGCGHTTPLLWGVGGWIALVEHNSYDYTALIDFVERPDRYPAWSHVFLLHDTMELGAESDRLIRRADPTKDATAVWGGECNLALYRADYLLSRRAEILALKNCTKLQAVEAEGFLWRTLADGRRGAYPGDIAIGAMRATYEGAERQCVRYAGVGITKYKANWGQTWPPSVVTP